MDKENNMEIKKVPCPECRGLGTKIEVNHGGVTNVPCSKCQGLGEIIDNKNVNKQSEH